MTNTIHQTSAATVITPEELLAHWQGHRKLTRKTIEAFPEDKLFTYSLGGMRPFSELAMEFIEMAGPGIKGIQSGVWKNFGDTGKEKPGTKEALLQLWDEITETINEVWPTIAPERFQEDDVAFGQWPGKIYWTLFYFIDNEIHHRGQGYVYLRSLGIEPPAFWDRG
jgi:uncharacterized damage-inducible protein DinB